ncbi:glycosyltransferase family protein [Paenibacillus sp. S28]|uniref:glycosyltransferase family protein n=1 Tax=Paenibacillus sp. S28 TaxID=2767463 RepID=UPI00190B8B7B|nr:glycosyltransferase [Paenibacillus sp. S28]MBJ9992283.1 glycosyltransferase [Paenibacillus sp. S28]
MSKVKWPSRVPELTLSYDSAQARARGRQDGYRRGYDEGYLRGRADVIASRPAESVPFRQIRVLYIASGKGYPYSPLDEAISSTLRTMVAEVVIIEPGQITVEAVLQAAPDLVLALDGMFVNNEMMDIIRQLGIRTAVWLTDDPYYTDMTTENVKHYDYIFTLESNCIPFYQQLGCTHVYHLSFAAHTEYYRPSRNISPLRRDVSFIGSAYWNRIGFFDPIIDRLMQHNTVFNGIWWDRLPQYTAYQDRIELNKWMGPAETAEAYNGSKIVINLHRSHEDDTVNNNAIKIPAASPNPRTFEISACATLQLSDSRSDLAKFYTPGVEIETYSSPEELLYKIEYYLAHEEERRQIALNALERTFRDHTYGKRLNEMLTIIYP